MLVSIFTRKQWEYFIILDLYHFCGSLGQNNQMIIWIIVEIYWPKWQLMLLDMSLYCCIRSVQLCDEGTEVWRHSGHTGHCPGTHSPHCGEHRGSQPTTPSCTGCRGSYFPSRTSASSPGAGERGLWSPEPSLDCRIEVFPQNLLSLIQNSMICSVHLDK